MGARIVVTGANGFLGRAVVQELLKLGADLVTTDLQPALAITQTPPEKAHYAQGDLTDERFVDTLTAFCGKADAIVHLAALLPRASNLAEGNVVVRANVESTMNVCELARRASAHVVFSSTALVYGDRVMPFDESMERNPGDYYGFSKSLCEQIIEFGVGMGELRATILRLGVLYGPGQTGTMFIPSMVRALVAREQFPMTAGEQTRDFEYVSDVAEFIAHCALTPKAGTYNVGTGVGVSLNEAARQAATILDAQHCLRVGVLPYRPRESWRYCLNSTKAQHELGWSPRTSFRDGLMLTIEYYRKAVSTEV